MISHAHFHYSYWGGGMSSSLAQAMMGVVLCALLPGASGFTGVPARASIVVQRPSCLAQLSADPGRSTRSINVTDAAAEAKLALAGEATQVRGDRLRGAALEDAIDLVNNPQSDCEAYLRERIEILGSLDSTELLDRDEAANFWPESLTAVPTALQMAFVDEISCTGCGWCPHVARSTFQMHDGHGKARAYQQGEDGLSVIEEAIDVCPANCIHLVTRDELRLLEEHRSLHLEDLQAQADRMGGNGHWRDPLTSDGWRRTGNCRHVCRKEADDGNDPSYSNDDGVQP